MITVKNADDKPYSSLQTDSSASELLTSNNPQCYHCLTNKSACLYRGGQFQSDEEGSICPIIPH